MSTAVAVNEKKFLNNNNNNLGTEIVLWPKPTPHCFVIIVIIYTYLPTGKRADKNLDNNTPNDF